MSDNTYPNYAIPNVADIVNKDLRIAALEAENARLRAVVANMANTINIVGSDYDQTIKALDRLVRSVKSQARAALAGKAEQ